MASSVLKLCWTSRFFFGHEYESDFTVMFAIWILNESAFYLLRSRRGVREMNVKVEVDRRGRRRVELRCFRS